MSSQENKAAASENPKPTLTFEQIITKSAKSGVAGGTAMAIQVFSLMWMRTTMNYQFKNGGGFVATLKKLYA